VVVSAIESSSKLDRVLLVSAGSPTRSPTSLRVICAHLGLCSGSTTASGCSDSAYDCTDSESESSKSSESEISSEEESTCACSSSRTGGRVKVSACDCLGTCETLSLNWTLRSMMSQSEKISISQYPFTLFGYPTIIHSVLCGSSTFLFLDGIWAHAREPKM
jgi:hypothetical protein